MQDPKQIKELAVAFYKQLVGSTSHDFTWLKAERVSQLIQQKFSDTCIAGMNAEMSNEEIRKTIFAMKNSKAPGPDSFSAGFYHKAYPIVGDGVVEAIRGFFFTRGSY